MSSYLQSNNNMYLLLLPLQHNIPWFSPIVLTGHSYHPYLTLLIEIPSLPTLLTCFTCYISLHQIKLSYLTSLSYPPNLLHLLHQTKPSFGIDNGLNSPLGPRRACRHGWLWATSSNLSVSVGCCCVCLFDCWLFVC